MIDIIIGLIIGQFIGYVLRWLHCRRVLIVTFNEASEDLSKRMKAAFTEHCDEVSENWRQSVREHFGGEVMAKVDERVAKMIIKAKMRGEIQDLGGPSATIKNKNQDN